MPVGDSSVSMILPKLYLNDAFKCQWCIYMLSNAKLLNMSSCLSSDIMCLSYGKNGARPSIYTYLGTDELPEFGCNLCISSWATLDLSAFL